jgi:DNA-binding LacI/PurR family transcriptional regulator
MQKFTIKDIAKIAGVSPSAISIALNDRPGVSDETRKNILEIIERLQYMPNPNSRRLLFNTTNNIAVLFKSNASPLDQYFYSELNRTILNECEKHGYNLMFASILVEGNKVVLPKVVKAYDVDGIIIYGDMETSILSEIKKFDIPFVLVDNHDIAGDMASVHPDYTLAAYTATKFLVDCGHRRIAYLAVNSPTGFSAQTFSGFKKAIEEYQLSLPLQWIQNEVKDDDEASLYECMEQFISTTPFPSAIFCAADIYAINAIRFIKKHHLKVPEDISVIGIDDILLSRYVEPSLTTIRIDKEKMGKDAISLLLKSIKKEQIQNIIVGSDSLIIRNSVKIIG